MTGVADKIMKRMRAKGRGKWVCMPKDFLAFGSRAAIDQALSRLTKSGALRRVGRGLYDLPRMSKVLGRQAPVDMGKVIAALTRRNGTRIMSDGIVAANRLGLTDAVPARTGYVTDGSTRNIKIGGQTAYLRHASPGVMVWAGRPSAPIAQALLWLGPKAIKDMDAEMVMRSVPDMMKKDLIRNRCDLPGWAGDFVELWSAA